VCLLLSVVCQTHCHHGDCTPLSQQFDPCTMRSQPAPTPTTYVSVSAPVAWLCDYLSFVPLTRSSAKAGITFVFWAVELLWQASGQYMFGDDIIVAPMTSPIPGGVTQAGQVMLWWVCSMSVLRKCLVVLFGAWPVALNPMLAGGCKSSSLVFSGFPRARGTTGLR
jgi:hypothetical protein